MRRSTIKKVAFVGNYLPRKCGIATFTHDLCKSVTERYPQTECLAVPVTDPGGCYRYPDPVRYRIAEQEPASYRQAADYLNVANPDVVSLQHEYGLFGGRDGRYIIELLRRLRMPVVTTMHTVLAKPTPSLFETAVEVAGYSSRIVVMAERGREMLRDIYGVEAAKIDLIPHGIPDVPFVDPTYYKERCGVSGRLTLLTFGLLGPSKGIENVIRALPEIVERHPEVIYLVLGGTHPNLLRKQGESYREGLRLLADELGVGEHLVFHNRFVSLRELNEFIGCSDIYITPYLDEAQITSGTLAYAFGAGKAVISTPYWHAQELLADGRGELVPFADFRAIAERVNGLIENEEHRHHMRCVAYEKSREMIWERAAERYYESFVSARDLHPLRIRSGNSAQQGACPKPRGLPQPNLDHLRRLTDHLGIWQHANFKEPRYGEGYCTDDNARALLLTVSLDKDGSDTSEAGLPASTYLAFLLHAFNRRSRRFRNFLGFERHWAEKVGSEDSHGRAVWALGTFVGASRQNAIRTGATELLLLALEKVPGFTSPRAWAFALLGIDAYLQRFPGDVTSGKIRDRLTDLLAGILDDAASPDWPWFEDRLTYANAKLPHALLVAAGATGRPELVERALDSLSWLMTMQTGDNGCFCPIGSNGWFRRGAERAHFDQQPIEAQASVSACLAAYRVTGDEKWCLEALRSFGWFLGENELGIPLYDPAGGGCRDALHVDRSNQNQGAESTLAFHLALAEMRTAYHETETAREAKEHPAAGARHQGIAVKRTRNDEGLATRK